MIWNVAIFALAVTAILSLFGSIWRITPSRQAKNSGGSLESFLLANGGLQRLSVINLLLSTSFSLNGLLYQAWLGYQIGLWALLVQGAWALSYVLLSKHTAAIREERSLHAFLGKKYGKATQILAGICSILGFTVLIGWEFNVARATFDGLINLTPADKTSPTLITIYTVSAVAICLLYTALGGLKSNVLANYVQNGVKLFVFGLLIVLLFAILQRTPTASIFDRLIPSPSKLIETIGIIGLITNVIFSLAWQYVDMSTWHSVIASKNALDESETRSALKWSGAAVFLAPGIVGTLLGAFLSIAADVSADNIMTKIVSILPTDNPILLFLVFFALLACVMAMIDGLLLASAYSLVCDIIFRTKSLREVDDNPSLSAFVLGWIRVFLVVIAILGTIGVYALLEFSGFSLFDVVYVLIIGQLSLFGAVIHSMSSMSQPKKNMAWSIAIGLAVGAAVVALGKAELGPSWFLESAGVLTMLASFVAAKTLR